MPLNNSSSAYFSVPNSTLMPLPANGVYFGDWEDVSQFSIIYTFWNTDQPGSVYYEFSIDGIVLDRSVETVTLDFTNGNYGCTGPRSRFFRLKYINGPVGQTKLRLQTTYSVNDSDAGHFAISSGMTAKTVGNVTRSLIFGSTTNNTYVPLKVASDGSLIMSQSTNSSVFSPILQTNRLSTSITTADQVILSYTPTSTFYLQGFSSYVWDTMSSSMVVFGEASLESPVGTKLYTSQLTSMGLGKDQVEFSQPLVMPANQPIRLVCSPSGPITNQTWQANLIGAI